jgi:hypothetical protein
MRLFYTLSIPLAGICLLAQTPTAPPADSDAQASATRGMPARATANDYLGHGPSGPLTIGAEFMQHSVPTPGMMLSTEDYVVVEAGVFGPPGARTTLNPSDFSIRINGKKPAQSEPYVAVFKTLKDPEWEPDVPVDKASKTSIGSSGTGKGGLAAAPTILRWCRSLRSSCRGSGTYGCRKRRSRRGIERCRRPGCCTSSMEERRRGSIR